eukprot:9074398-Alexandrium_andersonii.AAC.1
MSASLVGSEMCIRDRFLTQRWTRERFVATCLLPKDTGHHFEGRFERFTASIADWRWGSLISAIETLLPVETPLRHFWDLKLLLGKAAHPEGGQGPQVEGAEDDHARAHPAADDDLHRASEA